MVKMLYKQQEDKRKQIQMISIDDLVAEDYLVR